MYLKSWSDDRDSIYVYGQWTECWQGMSKLIVISQADMLVCKICVVSVFYLYHSLTGQGLLTCVIAKKNSSVQSLRRLQRCHEDVFLYITS